MFRDIDTIIIHCAVTLNGGWLTTERIDKWHADRGFHRKSRNRVAHNRLLKAIGYHYLISPGMPIATGRHLDEIGAHARGVNSKSIGICLAGTNQFTIDQWGALRGLVSRLLRIYPTARVIGHNTVNSHKTCPNFDVGAWLACGMMPMVDNLVE